jgi:hypothetical protein
MQDWLAQPQGYIAGSKTQDTEGGKEDTHGSEEKKKGGEAVLEKYVKDVEGKVNGGEGKRDCVGEVGSGSGREELLCMGAWTQE